MGRGVFCRTFCSVAVWALFLGLFAGVSGAASQHRGLERLLEDEEFTRVERVKITRYYGSTLKAGQNRRETLELVELCLEGEFGAKAIVRVLTLYAQLELADLPDEGFESKIQEGVAKRVSPMKILAAAEKRALAINRAEKILNSLILEGHEVDDREDLIPTVAEALESGKSEREIRKLLVEAMGEGKSWRRIRRQLLH